MALTKETKIDQIEVTEIGHIQIRKTITIFEDGKEISKTYHRSVLSPNDSLDGQDAKVVAIAKAAWIPEVIANYKQLIIK